MKPKAFVILAVFGIGISAVLLTCCRSMGKVRMDPISQEFYEYARLIMTKPEKEIFLMLPDKESREEFIQDFWAKRDPDPQTEENEFRQEFYDRIEYANKRFIEGIPGWKTDRGRIYIYLGPPDKIDQRPYINDPNIKGLIWWGYYRYRLGIEFIDRTGDGRYTLGRQAGSSGGLLEVIERAKFGQIYDDSGDIGKVFTKFKLDYDRAAKEIVIAIPVETLSFESAEKKLKAEFDFEFFIYAKESLESTRFKREKTYERTEEDILELDEIILTFPYDLKPGEYYVDVVVIVKPKIGKVRKIFKIKV